MLAFCGNCVKVCQEYNFSLNVKEASDSFIGNPAVQNDLQTDKNAISTANSASIKQ